MQSTKLILSPIEVSCLNTIPMASIRKRTENDNGSTSGRFKTVDIPTTATKRPAWSTPIKSQATYAIIRVNPLISAGEKENNTGTGTPDTPFNDANRTCIAGDTWVTEK